jgi:hypothetical protein
MGQAEEEARRLLAALGPFCRGTVLRRFMPCGKAGCRCQDNPPKLHGPYYQWTRKVRGKTMTVRVSRSEAQILKRRIANARAFDAVMAKAEALALRDLTAALRQARRSSSPAATRPRRRGRLENSET